MAETAAVLSKLSQSFESKFIIYTQMYMKVSHEPCGTKLRSNRKRGKVFFLTEVYFREFFVQEEYSL